MLKPRLMLGLVIIGLAFTRANAETIKLGKHDVHPTRIIAKYKEGISIQSRNNALAQENVVVHRQMRALRGIVVLEARGLPAVERAAVSNRASALEARIAALQATGLFEYVEPDYTVYPSAQPTDARFQDGALWGLRNLGGFGGTAGADINAELAWDITTGSTNVIVAVIDSGVRYTHQDLASQMWRNPGESGGGKESNGIDDDQNGFVDDVFGINAIEGTGDPMDFDDHGTHCAGTIGARANGSGPHVGVAWNVRIMALKFLGANGGQNSDAVTCIDYAVAMGAKISNNSWGGYGYSQAIYDAIKEARDAGHLFIAAASNDAIDNDVFPAYPASYDLDNIISVAAVDRADRLANFSNYGENTVDLGAPGVAIFSSTASTDSSYASFNGTSMAAPHVSGVAALLKAHLPTATYSEIRERILATTVPIPALNGRCVTGGRLNAYNALAASPDGQLEITIDPPNGAIILGGSTTPVFVRVTDLVGVNDATVTATLSLPGNLTFNNTGAAPDVTAADATSSANYIVPSIETNVIVTIVATAPGKLPITNSVEYFIIPPPTNDNFVSAAKIPNAGGQVLGVNSFATLELPDEPVHAGVATVAASVWWNWSAPTTGPVLVDTTGSSFDTVLAVYSGTSLSTLVLRAATNDSPTSAAGYLYFNAVAANTYRIVVAGANTNETGSVRLRVTPNGTPDTNPPVVTVTSHLSGSVVLTNRIIFAGIATDPTPNSSGISEVLLRVNGAFPPVTAVGTTNWSGSILLQLGANNVEAWAYDYAGNQSLIVARTIYYNPPPPSNDHFVNAIALAGSSGTSLIPATTLGTKEHNEPNHAGNIGGKSVWWKFVAPADGVLFLSTTNSTFDTLLGVYAGSAVGSLATVASNDDAGFGSFSELYVPMKAGTTNRIAVDGYAGAVGAVNLAYSFTPSPVYAVTVNVSGSGAVSPGTSLFASNAVANFTAIPQDEFMFSQWSGSVVSMANPLTFNVQGDMTITAQFVAAPHTDGFESGSLGALNWTTTGVPWIIQSTNVSAGSFAARSGVISHNQISSLVLTGDFNDGSISFDLRVSSEFAWDALRLLVDGDLVDEWSGEVPWQTYTFPIVSGTHTIEWRYIKDGSDVFGLDAAFIDNVDLPLNVAVTATSPAMLSLRTMTDGSRVVDLFGQANQTYVIETSSDLVNWMPLSTNILFGGVAHVPDPASSNLAPRFYRAYVPQP